MPGPTAPPRPYVVLSCAISADGYLDDASGERLILSGPDDLDEVDGLRAGVDAIFVGAGTIRADNPRLLIRSPARGADRISAGRPPHPLRVTLTASGDLDPGARFFTGPGERPLVFCADPARAAAKARLGEVAQVVGAGDPPSLARVLEHLYNYLSTGSARPHWSEPSVLIEGGSAILRDALTEDLADELRLAVAPFLVGDARAPRFGLPGTYPQSPSRPMRLESVRRVGEVAVLQYKIGGRRRPRGLPPAA
jgi:5-amino-6-(5-phosphoribosylamino)uracil reductase